MEIGMLVKLRERVGRRDRLLFTYATVPTFIILMTTVSCSRPDMPQPHAGIIDREQPRTATSPKVATVDTPKAKKTNTRPRLDDKREHQLFQEFLEWRERKKELP
jgi:hypothetical protein